MILCFCVGGVSFAIDMGSSAELEKQASELMQQSDGLLGELRALQASKKLTEVSRATRIKLREHLQRLVTFLSQSGEYIGDRPVNSDVLQTIGNFYARYAALQWDSGNKQFAIQVDPASQSSVEHHLAGLLQSLKDGYAVSNYRGPERCMTYPPSNEDLDNLEDFTDLISRGDVCLQHNVPCLNDPISPETERFLRDRQAEEG